jgi:integrase
VVGRHPIKEVPEHYLETYRHDLPAGTGEQRRTASGRPMWGGWRIRTRIFRQTYCAARLQTLDRGRPVSLYTVSRELGHDSEDMVRRVYARLGRVRHRVEAPEFRPEQWFDEIDGSSSRGWAAQGATIQAGRD